MNTNGRVTARLIKAFEAGKKRPFINAVAHLGVRDAAFTLINYLLERKESYESFVPQAASLLKPSNLTGIPNAPKFIHLMIYALSEELRNDRKKCAILSLFLSEITPEDLDELPLAMLGAPALKRLVKILPSLKNPMDWADAAFTLRDKALLNIIKPYLSSSDIFQLWYGVQTSYSQPELKMLLSCNLHPATEEEKTIILHQAVNCSYDQVDLMRSLVTAWPSVVSALVISAGPASYHSHWTGDTLRFLLEKRPCLPRGNWITVFKFQLPEVFARQVRALSVGRPLIDWNTPNEAGDGFLLEIYKTMGDVAEEHRMHVLETLLEAGADPRPLLARKARFELSPEEEKVMLQFAGLWASKRPALEPEKKLQPISTVLNLV